MKVKNLLIIVTLSVLVQNCAKQTAPTGGPKDETPPKLIKSDPKHQQTKFNGKNIELTFDELVQLNNPREQIIITPSIGKKFIVEAKKDKVTLNFNSPLQDSTTYNINFRESIQDLNEKNPAKGIKVAFSTGTYIDSLSISGNVQEALTEKEAKNFTVAAIQASDTFNVFKHPASWVTQTDEKGNFSLENLKPSKYFVYAFDDKNKNLFIDSKSERYGFLREDLNLKKSIDTLSIKAIKLDASNLKLISAKPTFSYYQIRLSKSLTHYEIKSTEKILSNIDTDNASIKIYNTMQLTDSLQIRLSAQDSTSNELDTAVYLKFNKQKSTKEKFIVKTEENNYLENKSLLRIVLSFSKPVLKLNQDSIYLQLDSINRISFSNNDFTWNEYSTRLTITKNLTLNKIETKNEAEKPSVRQDEKRGKPEEKQIRVANPQKQYNQLIFSDACFVSAELDSTKKSSQNVRIVTAEQTGALITKIETKENFILQVINKNNQVVQEITNEKTHKFENLPPDTYRLRLQIDLNKNGKWDTGNIDTRTLPEPIIFYYNPKHEKEINLKANWELGPLLITF